MEPPASGNIRAPILPADAGAFRAANVMERLGARVTGALASQRQGTLLLRNALTPSRPSLVKEERTKR